jgi:hypothetical protein
MQQINARHQFFNASITRRLRSLIKVTSFVIIIPPRKPYPIEARQSKIHARPPGAAQWDKNSTAGGGSELRA